MILKQNTNSKSNCFLLFTSIAAILFWPTIAFANAGTRFMFWTFFQLVAGNAAIGLFEGWLIARIFKTNKIRSIILMIAANYFSAWVGVLGLLRLSNYFESSLSTIVTVHNVSSFLWMLILLSWVITIILEWPFCFFIINKKEKRIQQSFYASLIAQTASYILLLIINPPFGHFYGEQDININFAPVGSFAANPNASIYYISTSDGDLYSIKPDGSSNKKVSNLKIMDKDVRLLTKQDPNTGLWSFYTQKRPSLECIIPQPPIDIGIKVQGLTKTSIGFEPEENSQSIFFTPAVDLNQSKKENYKVEADGLRDSLLSVYYPGDYSKIYSLHFDNFILHWATHDATVLPHDQVVYQLGNQIVLFDINQKKMGLITFGRSPVVFLEQ